MVHPTSTLRPEESNFQETELHSASIIDVSIRLHRPRENFQFEARTNCGNFYCGKKDFVGLDIFRGKKQLNCLNI